MDSKEYMVDEFDLVDPAQSINSTIRSIEQAVMSGYGDRMEASARRSGDEDMANMIHGISTLLQDPAMKLIKDSTDMMESGETAKALDIINDGLKEGIISSNTAVELSKNVYIRMGDMEGALMFLRKRCGPEARSPDIAYRLGHNTELENICHTWSDDDGPRNDYYINMARLAYVKGDTDTAQRRLDALDILEEYDPYTHEIRGDIMADAGDLWGAILQYNKALEKDYNEPYFHIKKVEALIKMGRPDSAAIACKRSLDKWPYNQILAKLCHDIQV